MVELRITELEVGFPVAGIVVSGSAFFSDPGAKKLICCSVASGLGTTELSGEDCVIITSVVEGEG